MKAARRGAVAAVIALAAGLGCGGPQTQVAADEGDFDCRDRVVEYVVAGGFAAAKAGVTVRCSPGAPRLEKWRTNDGGDEDRSIHRLSGSSFESLWERVESTGWRLLDECEAGGDDDDPVYAFRIADHAAEVRVTCKGKDLPFPFDRLVNELDLKAAGFD